METDRFKGVMMKEDQGVAKRDQGSVRSDRSIAIRSGLRIGGIGLILVLVLQAIDLSSGRRVFYSPMGDYLPLLTALICSGVTGYRIYKQGITRARYWFLSGFCAAFVLVFYFGIQYIIGSPVRIVTTLSNYIAYAQRYGFIQTILIDLLTIILFSLVLTPVLALPAILVAWIAKWSAEDPAASSKSKLKPQEGKPSTQDPASIDNLPRTHIPPALLPAYDLILAGQSDQVISWLARKIKEDPGSEYAWLLMAYAMDDPARKRECLKRVLANNPANQAARHLAANLDLVIPPPLPSKSAFQEGPSQALGESQAFRAPSPSSTATQLIVTSLGLFIIVVVPIISAATTPWRFSGFDQESYIRITAFLLTFILGVLLVRRGEQQIQPFLFHGAINGSFVGLIINLVISVLYHSIYLPAYGGDTKTQGMLRMFGDEFLISMIWGVLIGIVGACTPTVLDRGYRYSLGWMEANAPQNAWAAALAAALSKDLEKKRYYLSVALTQQPNNPLARRIEASLLASAKGVAVDAGTKKEKPAIRLPQLATTPLGQKFVRRLGIAFVIIFIWTMIEVIRGRDSTGFTLIGYMLCCTGLLIGSGFLLWALVQGFRRIAGSPVEDASEASHEEG
jgi:hypothetical protein